MKTNINVSIDDESLLKSFNNHDNNNVLSKLGRSNFAPDHDYQATGKLFKKNLNNHIEAMKKQIDRFIQKNQ